VTDLAALVLAYGAARQKVRAANTRTQFLKASADLWEAEQALDVAYQQLTRKAETTDGDD
jgi:hypothetical protein